jgi:hypothetical protein
MPTFVKSEQSPVYPLSNLPINIEHVKAISKAMEGFYYAIIFQFNEKQSFSWRYRTSIDRDNNYTRLISMMR